mmetsp:Transcript_11833/g.39192  ORF Transcript_11833/g.39192 Transcript_11833/m.39192 type:complete len:313 (+) Transcript_11833:2-940(+)
MDVSWKRLGSASECLGSGGSLGSVSGSASGVPRKCRGSVAEVSHLNRRLVAQHHVRVEGEEAEEHEDERRVDHQRHRHHHIPVRPPPEAADWVRRPPGDGSVPDSGGRVQRRGQRRGRVAGEEGADVEEAGKEGEQHPRAAEQGVEQEEHEELAVVKADGVDDPRAKVVQVEHDAARDGAVVAAQRAVEARLGAVAVVGGEPPVGRDRAMPFGRDGARVGEDGHQVRGEQQADERVEDDDAAGPRGGAERVPDDVGQVVDRDDAPHDEKHGRDAGPICGARRAGAGRRVVIESWLGRLCRREPSELDFVHIL